MRRKRLESIGLIHEGIDKVRLFLEERYFNSADGLWRDEYRKARGK